MLEQEFYKEKAGWKALREERFLAMAEREGLSRKKTQAKHEDNKARARTLSLTSIISRDHKRHPSTSPGWMHQRRGS